MAEGFFGKIRADSRRIDASRNYAIAKSRAEFSAIVGRAYRAGEKDKALELIDAKKKSLLESAQKGSAQELKEYVEKLHGMDSSLLTNSEMEDRDWFVEAYDDLLFLEELRSHIDK